MLSLKSKLIVIMTLSQDITQKSVDKKNVVATLINLK